MTSVGAGALVVGGAAMDVIARPHRTAREATSNPGIVTTSAGGVGRNIAENLARLGTPVTLVSRVGADPFGTALLEHTSAAGVDIGPVATDADSTAAYVAWLDNVGDLALAVSDFAAVDQLTPAALDGVDTQGIGCVVIDGNVPLPVAQAALDLAADIGARALVEPVSVAKAARLADLVASRPVWAVTPNADELTALAHGGDPRGLATLVWVRRGPWGSTLLTADGERRFASAAPPGPVRDVTGAGDAMTAAFVDAVLRGLPVAQACERGHRAAALTVTADRAVHPAIARALLDPAPHQEDP